MQVQKFSFFLAYKMFPVSTRLGIFPPDRTTFFGTTQFKLLCSLLALAFILTIWRVILRIMFVVEKNRTQFFMNVAAVLGKVIFSGTILISNYVILSAKRSQFESMVRIHESKRGMFFCIAVYGARVVSNFYSLVSASTFVEWCSIFVDTLRSIFHLFIFFTVLQVISTINFVLRYLKNIMHSDSLANENVQKHSKCIDLLCVLNSAYGFQILLIVTRAVLAIIAGVHFLITSILHNQLQQFDSPYINESFSVFFSCCEIYLLCSRSSKATVAIDAFYKELFRLMRESNTLCSDKKLCLYLTVRRTVNFTACGFFSLGYPLITSIIAAATTYLVILIQFSLPKNL